MENIVDTPFLFVAWENRQEMDKTLSLQENDVRQQITE